MDRIDYHTVSILDNNVKKKIKLCHFKCLNTLNGQKARLKVNKNEKERTTGKHFKCH